MTRESLSEIKLTECDDGPVVAVAILDREFWKTTTFPHMHWAVATLYESATPKLAPHVGKTRYAVNFFTHGPAGLADFPDMSSSRVSSLGGRFDTEAEARDFIESCMNGEAVRAQEWEWRQ